jgi:hypothetical protein
MTPIISAFVLGLAWFAAINTMAAGVAIVIARRAPTSLAGCPRRARALLIVRFFPFVAATAFAALVFAPAHAWLEPANPDERYGIVLLSLAGVGLLLIAKAGWNLAHVARGAMLLRKYAARSAGPHNPARITHVPGVGIALAGVVRPRILIGTSARRLLTAAELDVAVAHEEAHRRAYDNLTRALMLCLPDVFGWTSSGRRLEQRWAAEAECLADARAIDGDRERAACLASALVKVARVVSSRQAVGVAAWSSFHDRSLLQTRVRLLVNDRPAPVPQARGFGALVWMVIASVGAVWLAGIPAALHQLTELLVARLP